MADIELPRVLGVVALGGVIGSLARYGLAEAIPHGPTGFPWATFVTNVLGCFAIGLLLTRLTPRSHPLLRPFLGTGILGGFTTFSTFAVDTEKFVARSGGRCPDLLLRDRRTPR